MEDEKARGLAVTRRLVVRDLSHGYGGVRERLRAICF